MHRQQLLNPPLKALKGLLVVGALAATVLLDSLLAQLLTAIVTELVAAVFFWCVGILIALWTLRRYVMGYSYALTSSLLIIAHLYGRYERRMEEIYLNNIVFAGTPEAVRKRYPDARVHRAVLTRNPTEVFAIAYRDDGKTAILLFQPDPQIRATLESAGRKK